jgi:hypothetical protein
MVLGRRVGQILVERIREDEPRADGGVVRAL